MSKPAPGIVERLRRSAQERKMCHEAADEIERLRDLVDEKDRDIARAQEGAIQAVHRIADLEAIAATYNRPRGET